MSGTEVLTVVAYTFSQEQATFLAQASGAGVAGQFAVGGDDAVAGDGGSERIGGERLADGARGFRMANFTRDPAVRTGFTLRDLCASRPDLLVERGVGEHVMTDSGGQVGTHS